MTTRAQLQSKSIDELRQIAEAVGIETDGLQKSKLISALADAGQVCRGRLPVGCRRAAPGDGAPGADLTVTASPSRVPSSNQVTQSQARRPASRDVRSSRMSSAGGNRQRRRRRGGGGTRDDEFIPEEELEVREGLLDILPEGYGFLRVTGYSLVTTTFTCRPTRFASSVSARVTSFPARSGRHDPRRSSPQ